LFRFPTSTPREKLRKIRPGLRIGSFTFWIKFY
jgi:hypothetical protein